MARAPIPGEADLASRKQGGVCRHHRERLARFTQGIRMLAKLLRFGLGSRPNRERVKQKSEENSRPLELELAFHTDSGSGRQD